MYLPFGLILFIMYWNAGSLAGKPLNIVHQIDFLCCRKKSKAGKEARRMVCDCTISKSERARGISACGEDCLNRLLLIEWSVFTYSFQWVSMSNLIISPGPSAHSKPAVDCHLIVLLTAQLEVHYRIFQCIGRGFFHEKGLESWGCGLAPIATKIWEHHTMNITYEWHVSVCMGPQ